MQKNSYKQGWLDCLTNITNSINKPGLVLYDKDDLINYLNELKLKVYEK